MTDDDATRQAPPPRRSARRPLDSSQIRGEEPLRGAGVTFRDLLIQTRKGPRRALTVTPTRPFVLGRTRLASLRGGETDNLIEEAIVTHVRHSKHTYDLFIFRACSHEGEPRYRLDEGLPPNEADELARRLLLSNLTCWRRLLDLEIPLILHTGMGPDRRPFQAATRKITGQPNAFSMNHWGDDEVPKELYGLDDRDLWLLRHVVFFFGQTYRVVAKQVLPEMLPMMDARREKLMRLSTPADVGG